jgi:ABC-type lipoprotein release transport system permease subunit
MRALILRGLTYYWRTNLAVLLGVATAVAVLAGALLVGDSVRGSLRDLVVGRLGKTDAIVSSAGFFRDQLAMEVRTSPGADLTLSGATPLIVSIGTVTEQESGRRAGQVRVYGVDDRFWRFHELTEVKGPADREAFISAPLAAQLESAEGRALLVRVQRPTDFPLESLHGRRDNIGRTIRLTVRKVLPSSQLGEFSLDASQADIRAIFVPLSRLQQELEVGSRVNTALLSYAQGHEGPINQIEEAVRRSAQLDDLGVTVQALEAQHALVVGSAGGVLDDARAAAVVKAVSGTGYLPQPMFTYLANSLRVGDREVPYSLVTATDAPSLNDPNSDTGRGSRDQITLNEWAAMELQAKPGDPLTMEYYVFEEPGRLVTRTASLRVGGIVPISAGDRDMAPSYPGITDSPTLEDWNPPFPVDLRRIRPVDERYWEQYRTTPKAFLSLGLGQQLWRTRYGGVTSMRIAVPMAVSLADTHQALVTRLRGAMDPLALGLAVRDVRAQSLEASRGATDFGEYFVYFSFFLVVSALLLAALFFKLGVEQRVREVGLLRAVGFGPAQVRRLFLGEGLLLAVFGSVIGAIGALAYAWLIVYGLRSWWVDAVGTRSLALHVSPLSLVIGAIGGVLAAAACIWWTLRSLSRISERSLLTGELEAPAPAGTSTRLTTRRYRLAMVLLVLGAALVIAGLAGWGPLEGTFFGAGAAFLGASLYLFSAVLRRQAGVVLEGHGWQPVSRLGFRYARYRPGRSVVSMAVIASATFILISVDAFRRAEAGGDLGEHSGVGGYSAFVETNLPVVEDPNTQTGRESLGLTDLDASIVFEPFRLLPGDDASCLNLYEPRNPRILAPNDAFLTKGRFSFQNSLASTDEERANPWLLLTREQQDETIPVIADANSMTYVLHRQLGEELVITHGGRNIRLRFVAALRDSIFQGELLMSRANFVRLFPEQEGYRVLLMQAPAGQAASAQSRVRDALTDHGAEVVGTAERLAQFHRVENTYLSTFQALGGLGLLLGTVGLATVLLRNVLERRKELALLGAVGYRPSHVLTMVVAENVMLLGAGLLAGAICAALAIAPAVVERGGRVPLTSSGALLLFGVFMTGLLSSVVAMSAATRAPLLAALRSE